MSEKYRPANGADSMAFMERFCWRCKHDQKYQITQAAEDGCRILADTMAFDIDDPEYPDEWIYQDGNPVCTKFEEASDG